jgi:dipeptidyl aminopeptidase/acylaminoacyl peptidase
MTLSGRYIPLVVVLQGGPHDMSTTDFQFRAKVFLKLGFAVLMVNYRGAIGNGDKTLQSILGNVAKVS